VHLKEKLSRKILDRSCQSCISFRHMGSGGTRHQRGELTNRVPHWTGSKKTRRGKFFVDRLRVLKGKNAHEQHYINPLSSNSSQKKQQGDHRKKEDDHEGATTPRVLYEKIQRNRSNVIKWERITSGKKQVIALYTEKEHHRRQVWGGKGGEGTPRRRRHKEGSL